MTRFPAWYQIGGASAQSEPAGWDAVELGGIKLNGKALIVGGDGIPLKIDPRQKQGANGGNPTTHGLDTAEFTLRIVVWTLEQMQDVDDALPLLCPPVNLEPVSIDHPQLRSVIRLLGKVDVLVRNAPVWMPSSVVPRGWEIHLRLLHWPVAAKQAQTGRSQTPARPKPPSYSTPNARAAAAAGNPVPTSSEGFGGPLPP